MTTPNNSYWLVLPMIYNSTNNFLPGTLQLTLGRRSDYHELARFHYAPGSPATFAAVICAFWRGDDAWDSSLSRSFRPNEMTFPRRDVSRGSDGVVRFDTATCLTPYKESAARAAASESDHALQSPAAIVDSRLVAVAVLSYPSALHRTRHRVFGLKPIPFGHRLRWVNAHLRTISRVIVHPQFRGIGLSTRLIQAAVDLCPTTYIEASARMGRAHPLFDRAGFARVEPMTDDEPIYYWRRREEFLTQHLVPAFLRRAHFSGPVPTHPVHGASPPHGRAQASPP